ncbi:PKD domain-containing protein, partial [Flavobacterium xinjiangense]
MKKITFIRFLAFLILLFTTTIGYSQNTNITFDNTNASLTTTPACTFQGCVANDVTFGDVYLGDNVGNLATLAYVANPVNGLYIWVTIASNSSKYDLLFQFDYLVGGIRKNFNNTNFVGATTDRLTIKVRGSIITAGSKYRMAQITNYTAGQSLELKNIYLGWNTNGGAIKATENISLITCDAPKCSNAYSSGIIIKTPLFADFSISKNCDGGTFQKVVYTSTSTGVEANTSYSWSFPGAATVSPISLTTMGPYTVTYSSVGPYSASLTVTDPTSQVIPNTKTIGNITLTSCCTIAINSIAKTNVQCNGNSNGTVTATKTGGVGTITYDLLFSPTSAGSFTATGLPTNGDSNGTYTGLGVGFYKVVVSEGNGCSNTSSEVQITQPTVAVSVSGIATNATCFGEA